MGIYIKMLVSVDLQVNPMGFAHSENAIRLEGRKEVKYDFWLFM